MKTSVSLLLLVLMTLAFHLPAGIAPAQGQADSSDNPRKDGYQPYTLHYSQQGDLVPPANYREWIFLSSGLDMSYTAQPSGSASFDNVFVDPASYRSFLRTGTWPDKTVLVLESRRGQSKGSINQSGHFQEDGPTGIELHVKDKSRFPDGWAFFDVATPTRATLFPAKASCYSCHRDHAGVDTTFVQFYPTLMPVARATQTLSTAYLKENADKSK